ncbi:G6-like (plasmid) [Dictyostelium discoideum]|uniref:G6-like n=1 Tax=Dictyostelium discoideum TaxID=44689 RepID=O60986_DICDI|nr:G6-like [Dictyostelium discoideum]AAC14393.1 G6-like [Dictyostelium discoideum]|eukprot:NP_046746.1 G6-like (plasmid) [Dictyostelium discoideum]
MQIIFIMFILYIVCSSQITEIFYRDNKCTEGNEHKFFIYLEEEFMQNSTHVIQVKEEQHIIKELDKCTLDFNGGSILSKGYVNKKINKKMCGINIYNGNACDELKKKIVIYLDSMCIKNKGGYGMVLCNEKQTLFYDCADEFCKNCEIIQTEVHKKKCEKTELGYTNYFSN